MFHHMLNCTMTHKNRVSLVIKDYKLIEEFPDSDFFGPYKVKKSKLSGRICFKENSRTLKKLFRHYQPPSSSGEKEEEEEALILYYGKGRVGTSVNEEVS